MISRMTERWIYPRRAMQLPVTFIKCDEKGYQGDFFRTYPKCECGWYEGGYQQTR